MIIGNGMLATAFRGVEHERICVYASGVSNSACDVEEEFAREARKLEAALDSNSHGLFIYFSTCSIADSASQNSAYVLHKRKMEEFVSLHRNYLLLRLPQIAGRTTNANTLLNYLNACILEDVPFQVWKNASRNIIDIDDVVLIAEAVIRSSEFRNQTINIANSRSTSLLEIVEMFERLHQKSAKYTVIDKGAEYNIDVSAISKIISDSNIGFDDFYLERTLQKYYRQERK